MTVFNGSNGGTFYSYLRLDVWVNWQDSINNYTNVGYEISLVSNNGYPFASGGSYPWQIKNGGTVVQSGTINSYDVPSGGRDAIASGNFNVYHEASGQKWCDFYSSFSGTHGMLEVWGSMALPVILRESTPSVALRDSVGQDAISECDYGEWLRVYTNALSSAFRHNITFNWHGIATTVSINAGVSTFDWQLPSSYMNNIPNSTSNWGTVTLDTYNGDSWIGGKSVSINAYVPPSVVPVLGVTAHSEAVTAVTTAGIGAYVQGLSRVHAVFSGTVGAYGSSITAYEVMFEGKTYNWYDVTTDYITGIGARDLVFKITDSRGRTASRTVSITSLAYGRPMISALTALRNISLQTTLDVRVTGSWYGLTANNAGTAKVYTSEKGLNVWTLKSTQTNTTGIIDIPLQISSYAEDKAYDIKLEFYDEFTGSNPSTKTISVGTISVPMSWSKTGMSAGKVWQQGALDIGGDVYANNKKLINADGNFHVNDNRTVATPTDLGSKGMLIELKNNSIDGLADGGTYHSVVTIQNWDDNTSGTSHQLGLTDNNRLAIRTATIGGAWGAWSSLYGTGHNPSLSVLGAEAVIEKGTTAYGGYIKFIDGTMCTFGSNYFTGGIGFYSQYGSTPMYYVGAGVIVSYGITFKTISSIVAVGDGMFCQLVESINQPDGTSYSSKFNVYRMDNAYVADGGLQYTVWGTWK